MVLGQSNSKAKIESWRMERFVLPDLLRRDRFIRTEIRQLLTEATGAERALERSLRIAAKLSIAKGDRKLQPDKWNAGKWIPGDVSKFMGKSTIEAAPPVLGNYWSTLESRFHEILREYTLTRDSNDIRCEWLKSVKDTLMKTWNQYSASVSVGDAWAIRALVKSEQPVLRKLKELNDEIVKLQPQEENA